ncbi:hypothetical protein [Sporomusa aerivorans]|uniref:hypothetical protein n=1 Tax=Sporomusa aerivorans TaxID=204936 RepID=UPI00352BCAB6
MALKLRVSLYMAVAASILTLLVGALNSITETALIYRIGVSSALFAILGYICGQFAERFLQEKLVEMEATGQNIDIVSNDDHGDEVPASEFTPLNPENFENITLTQK